MQVANPDYLTKKAERLREQDRREKARQEKKAVKREMDAHGRPRHVQEKPPEDSHSDSDVAERA
jgi:hypothetical protein